MTGMYTTAKLQMPDASQIYGSYICHHHHYHHHHVFWKHQFFPRYRLGDTSHELTRLIVGQSPLCRHVSTLLTKTSYMIFGTRKYNDINLRMQNTPLTRQYETKFLGIILSANLKWHKHIDVVLNKTSKNIGIISKVRHLLPPYLTRMLYMTLVEPYPELL